MTWSPGCLTTGSASPVSSDSSISSPSASTHTPSTTTLSPGPISMRSSEHDLGRADLGRDAVPPYRRPRLPDHGERVQGLLRPPLLDDADARVGEDDEAEEAVLDRRDEQHDQPQHADDRVEPGEDVRADDLGHRAAAAHRNVVDLAARDPLGDLGGGQARRRRGSGTRGAQGRASAPASMCVMHSTVRADLRLHPPSDRKIRPGEERTRAVVVRPVAVRAYSAVPSSDSAPGRRRPLDRRVALPDVPDAEQPEPASGQAGPQPPQVAVVVEPAVEGELYQEEDEPEDRAADDGGDDGALQGLRRLVLGVSTSPWGQLTRRSGLRAEIASVTHMFILKRFPSVRFCS